MASTGPVGAGCPSTVADQPGIQYACSESCHGTGELTLAASRFDPATVGTTCAATAGSLERTGTSLSMVSRKRGQSLKNDVLGTSLSVQIQQPP